MPRIVPLMAMPLLVALFWLGAPRVIASVLKAPAHRTVWEIFHGQTPGLAQLKRASSYLDLATRWEQSASLYNDLGFLLLLEAIQTEPDDPRRKALADQATKALRHGLLLSPSRPHPWVRLAYARVISGAQPSEVATLLARSVDVGPFVGEIAITRLELLMRAWDHLSPEMQRYTLKQIRFVWINAADEMIKIAKQSPRPGIIRFALRPIPKAVERLEAAVPPPSN